MAMPISIAQVTAEHHHDGFGISHPSPRLSWRFGRTELQGWRQAFYELMISRPGHEPEKYRVDSSESVLVPWPSSPLSSREVADIQVRATAHDGSTTPWASLRVEAALINRSDWVGKLISGAEQPVEDAKRPIRLRKAFTCSRSAGRARLYATAHGLYQIEINGQVVGDQVLAPGWQSYKHRLHYQVYDVSGLVKEGENVVGAYVGEGWYAGRLGSNGRRNLWGDRLGFLCQLEVDGRVICATDDSWEYLDGPIITSEIYDGEVIDSTLNDSSWSTVSGTTTKVGVRCTELPFPSAQLVSPDVAPVRRICEIKPVKVIRTPKGKTVLDFGQNLVGWLRIEKDLPGKEGEELFIRHAEVMEHGELGTRPLRSALARDIVKLGGKTKGYEPSFTFHGFRYAEITGYDAVTLNDFTAIVISSDLRRTGTFECSHLLINKLHENTVWSMRGNFVSVPTDCPQRDERLGWTGDLQVFALTANYLFDTAAFLGTWLRDLEADQRDAEGVVPSICPAIPLGQGDAHREKRPMAAWADCAIITPWELYNDFGDQAILEAQWESMRLWLEKGVPRDKRGFYATTTPQYGDWLDPRSPPALPGHCPSDNFLVANAYLTFVTGLAATIAKTIGKSEAAVLYSNQARLLRQTFQAEYITANGRLVSDTQTAYCLGLHFGLFEKEHLEAASQRLAWITRWEEFKITTGFAGTPIILLVLAQNGLLNLAYRMLQEGEEPSWLYPIRMGATTIWERWNSMLPDGSINPGQMTSFNHYALGSVCTFLHRIIGGLSPLSPGWKTALVHPQPGGSIRHAATSFDSPYGLYAVDWQCEGAKMSVKVTVPPNGEARVLLNGVDETVGSGQYQYEVDWNEDPDWPPEPIYGPEGSHSSSGLLS